ncbi:MAG: TonB-dependent siderophore receptor, partial [Gluconacetobacter diazotrophicus]|nr:TonB-dependent siderophore receptor [Gluconacetobacter diazotrophicus]
MRSCIPFRRGLVSCLLASAAILPSPALARQADAPTGTGTANAPELVSVTGDRLARWVPKDSSAATKTDQPLITTPESVSVVTRAQMDEQNARTLGEALRYTAGVASEADRGYSTRYDLVSIRGFQSNGDQYLDGLRLFGGAYYAVQKIDPFLLDGYQVLKGPPSVLYGQSSPGGIIALTPKAPTAARVRDAEIEGGTFGYVRGTADLGGRIDENGHWLFRLPVTGTTSGSQDRNTHTDTVAAMPSLSWLPTDRDTLTVTGLVQWDPRGGDYDTAPIQGTILPNPNGRFENDYYPGDNKFETFDQTQAAIGYRYEHRFNPDWSFRSLGRYANVGEQYRQVYGTGILDADLRTDQRYTAASKEHFDTITLEQQLLGHVDTGPVRHALLFGVNWQNLRDHYNFYGGTAPSIDAFAPNNDQPIPAPTLSLDRGVSTNQEGLFAQDEMVLGRLHGQVGVREDWSEIATRDVLSPATGTDQGDRAFTWRAGILYAFPQGVSPYFNYARSFQPTNQTDFFGTPFKPTRGE